MGMKKFALSIINPISYLVCSGVKWVENRTWTTEYRGRVYIHSSSMKDYGFASREFFPKKLLEDYDEVLKQTGYKEPSKNFVDSFIKKNGEARWLDVTLMADGLNNLYTLYDVLYGETWEELKDEKEQKAFFKEHERLLRCSAIIGHVDLVDIKKDSQSSWAASGEYHWIFDNPVLYKQPVRNVKGKLRLFDVTHITMPDD